MKKLLLSMMAFSMLIMPAAGEASYLLRLKNGRELLTSGYWGEGRQIYFYYGSGIAGIEEKEISRVEIYKEETDDYVDAASENTGGKGLLPLPAAAETPMVKEGREKVNLDAYKNKKDQMTVELDELLGKMRAATSAKDKETEEKIKQEIRNLSGQIYKLTDEVKEKNKGKLPEGWWGK